MDKIETQLKERTERLEAAIERITYMLASNIDTTIEDNLKTILSNITDPEERQFFLYRKELIESAENWLSAASENPYESKQTIWELKLELIDEYTSKLFLQ